MRRYKLPRKWLEELLQNEPDNETALFLDLPYNGAIIKGYIENNHIKLIIAT